MAMHFLAFKLKYTANVKAEISLSLLLSHFLYIF